MTVVLIVLACVALLGRVGRPPRVQARPLTDAERAMPLYDLIAHREIAKFLAAWDAQEESHG